MSGGFADVFKGSTAEGDIVALKRVRRTQITDHDPKHDAVILVFPSQKA